MLFDNRRDVSPSPPPITSVSTTRESATEQSATGVMFSPLPPPIHRFPQKESMYWYFTSA